jgi:hypothetical protein
VTAPGEAGLLDAARAGDAQALETLLEQHEPRLYRFARRLCRSPADAEDVLQESLLAAARGIGGFRGASSLSTWLYTIARSHCIKKHRRRRSAPEVATVTGLSVSAVKSRLHRARARVREELAPLLAPRGEPAVPTESDRPCPEVIRLFSRYLEGDISPRTCARMEKHLAACPRCRASCDALRSVLETCRAAPTPEIPPALLEKVRTAIRRVVEPAEMRTS